MIPVQLILSATWICLMFTYLLGDVLRIFAGSFEPGKMQGKKVTQWMWMVAAVMMLIPIVMILLSLLLPYEINRPLNIIAAVVLFLFNLMGVNGYPDLFDRFLIVVGLLINIASVMLAWNWVY